MRRDHHPFWAEKALAKITELWAERFLLPHFDAVGVEPRFSGPHYIHIQGPNVRVGDHFHAFGTASSPVSMAVNPYDGGAGDGEIVIGDFCVISSGVRIRSALSVRIGDNCMLAENCYITDADWHDTYHRIYPGKRAAVSIGNNVWLADSVTVTKGVTIGDNSIVGASSVVTRDVPDNTIVAGNPARTIGELDPAQPISRRQDLFVGGRPYEAFKDEYDRKRLEGNSLRSWFLSRYRPKRST